MDRNMEQSVSGQRSPFRSLIYGLCWLGIIVLDSAALVFAAGAIGAGPDSPAVNWPALALTIVFIAAALILHRFKDRLRVEYDYILSRDAFSVFAIYNGRRRRRLLAVEPDRVEKCMPVSAADAVSGVRVHKWYLNGDAKLYALYYKIDNERHAALLELSDELAAQLQTGRQSSGVRRETEGKF